MGSDKPSRDHRGLTSNDDNMTYQDFFNLTDTPFRLTPDIDYFFNSEGHGAALETLLYSIRSGEGFVQITGQPGVGKTILVRHLLNQLGGEVKTALILHPRLGAEDLLRVILEDLGVPTKVIEKNSKERLLRFFRDHLLETGREGCTTVVIVDEAQEIPDDTLEELRLLSNLETEKKKLLSIILVGQTELEEKLNHSSLRQLHQRITIRYRIEPFSRKETIDYILHRLSIAGATGNVHFSDRVLKRIHKKSEGIPRRINIICERALMAACVEGVRVIKNRHLRSAVESYLGTTSWPGRRLYAMAAGVLLVAVIIGGGWWAYLPENRQFILANTPSSLNQVPVAVAKDDEKSSAPAKPLSPSQTSPMVALDAPSGEADAFPPVDMLPKNWRCLMVDRQNDRGRVWQGDGDQVVIGASFSIQDILLDDGLYLLGKDSSNAPFILNHHDFSPWQRYRDLAARLWQKFGADSGLPIIPLVIGTGSDDTWRVRTKEESVQIRAMVKGWADAWRSLDMDAHIRYYSSTHVNYPFWKKSPVIVTREQYYRQKGRLFKKNSYITLQISDPVCLLNPADSNTAMALFSQRYAAARYLDEGVKVLFLRRLQEPDDARPVWKIEGRCWLPMPSGKEG